MLVTCVCFDRESKGRYKMQRVGFNNGSAADVSAVGLLKARVARNNLLAYQHGIFNVGGL